MTNTPTNSGVHERGFRVSCRSLEEARGLTYQAAFFLQKIAQIQFFDGANHRTGYVAAKMFLRRNGKRFKVEQWEAAYSSINNIETKTLEDIQQWIEHGTTEESQ